MHDTVMLIDYTGDIIRLLIRPILIQGTTNEVSTSVLLLRVLKVTSRVA